jgi:cytochrome P450
VTARRVTEFEWPSAEVAECPYPFYDALREEAPVYRYPGRNEYLVSRWEDIAYVEEHPELFSVIVPGVQLFPEERARRFADDPMTPWAMFAEDPPEHAPKRALTLSMVHRDKLASYEPMIRRISGELIEAFVERGTVEFYSEFAEILPLRVIMEILGLPEGDFELCKRLSDITGTSVAYEEDAVTPQERLFAEGNAYMERHILDRVEQPRNDFLGDFVREQVDRDGRLALGYLSEQAYNLLFAGNITTTHMLGSAMLLLLENPDTMRRVRSDQSLLRSMIEEVLRLESPVQFILRHCVQDAEIAGVPIAAGANIVLFLGAGNRDGRRFEDAAEFCPERQRLVKDNLAFGRGIHLCMGAPLARLEGQLAFEEIFARLHNLRLAQAPDEIRHLDDATFRAPASLRVEFDAAVPAAS